MVGVGELEDENVEVVDGVGGMGGGDGGCVVVVVVGGRGGGGGWWSVAGCSSQC